MTIAQVPGGTANHASHKHGSGKGSTRARHALEADPARAPRDRKDAPPVRSARGSSAGYEAVALAQGLQPKRPASGVESASGVAVVVAAGDHLELIPSGSSEQAVAATDRAENSKPARQVRESQSATTHGFKLVVHRESESSTAPFAATDPGKAASDGGGVQVGGSARTPSPVASPSGSLDDGTGSASTAPASATSPEAQIALSIAGNGAQHYGSFPVLVGGQLVELDLYTLSQRASGTVSGVRRLFLSMSSTSLGKMEVVAQASENRLSVSFAGATDASAEAVDEHLRAIGELASRLGWTFDSVQHVTDADSQFHPGVLDRLL